MDKRSSYDMVQEFHETFNHPVKNGEPSLDEIGYERVEMRMNLIAEEFFELVGAVYSDAARKHMETQWSTMYDDHLDEINDDFEVVGHKLDVIEAADALGDMEYVINGFALESGIPLPSVMEEIHSSNMSKLGEDGKPIYRADNKVLKGPNYFKPDIAWAMGMKEKRGE